MLQNNKFYMIVALLVSSSQYLICSDDSDVNRSGVPQPICVFSHNHVDLKNPDKIIYAGNTALHCVAETNFVHGICELLEKGANVNIQNSQGKTPLHCARTAEALKILIAGGADMEIKDYQGRTALHQQICNSFIRWWDLNIKSEYQRAAVTLIEAGANVSDDIRGLPGYAIIAQIVQERKNQK